MLIELKTKNVINKINLLKSKKRDIIINLLEFAINKTTFCY